MASTTGSQTVELASRDGKVCYLLGPVGLDGSDVTEAKAILDASGEWAVSLLVRPSRRATANALLDDCFEGTPTCPPPGSWQSPST